MKEGRKGTIRATVFPSCRWKLNFSVNLTWPGRHEATQRCPGDELMESSVKNNTVTRRCMSREGDGETLLCC